MNLRSLMVLEVWLNGDNHILSLNVPMGYPCPRVEEMIVAPNDQKFRVRSVVHQLNFVIQDKERRPQDIDNCFVIRILVDEA